MLFAPPEIIRAETFTRLPDRFRALERSEWADANRGGSPVDSFLEGPSFGRDGTLYVVDIPFGRVFAISPSGDWRLAAQYEGWPNGLKLHKDGRIFIADYRQGLVTLDPASGAIAPLLRTRHSESFKGLNDLHFAANGDLYFTDQGQTGLHDPAGRVYRLTAAGRLEQLIGTVPSPNGLVLNLLENQLFVAVTRANAVWRLPLMGDGSVAKAGLFLQLSGGASGPDGMALDVEGGLVVAHLGLGVWRFDAQGRPTHLIETELGGQCTNVAFGGQDNRDLFITESQSGTILRARLPVPGQKMFGLS